MSKGRITISRYTSSTNEGGVTIEFVDNDSRIHFAKMTLTLEAFARVVTGQGEVEGILETRGLELIGKQGQNKTELIVTPRPYGDKKLLAQAKKAVQKFEVDGWKARQSDLENAHNYYANGIQVTFYRYVEKSEAQGE